MRSTVSRRQACMGTGINTLCLRNIARGEVSTANEAETCHFDKDSATRKIYWETKARKTQRLSNPCVEHGVSYAEIPNGSRRDSESNAKQKSRRLITAAKRPNHRIPSMLLWLQNEDRLQI
jgi:hypothetical protein